MLKKDELRDHTSCLNKAAGDEPVFVLRGNDPLAGMTIRHWATMAGGIHDDIKRAGALIWAEEMDKWHANTPDRAAKTEVREPR